MSSEKDNKDKDCESKFKLFAYFSMTIVTIAILVGLVFLFQHTELTGKQEHVIETQQNVIENQQLLKKLINDSRAHEDREEQMLGNNTSTNIKISKSNSERLDLLLKHFNITLNL